MVNRTEWCWCEKCDCWTKSRRTKSHGTSQDKASDNEKGANLIIDPSVWLLSSEDDYSSPMASYLVTTVIVTIALAILAVLD